jgi:hypothetical protein
LRPTGRPIAPVRFLAQDAKLVALKLATTLPAPSHSAFRVPSTRPPEGDFMIELELTRSPDDRRLYVLGPAGTLRLEGLFSRSATAEGGGKSWHFARPGFWQRVIQATDTFGSVVGEFSPRDLRRGGRLHWAGRELTLRPASSWHERYVLTEGERELVLIDGKSWGRRPVKVTLADPGAIEPGLLLFAAFIVRQLAVNADSTSSAATTAAMSGSYSG